MTYPLDSIVPWGRSMKEYNMMFRLNDPLSMHIASFGDGPASFNAEVTAKGGRVVSFDPIYQFSGEEIAERMERVRGLMMRQIRENQNSYIWKSIRSPNELELIRLLAMKRFLKDYEEGRRAGRYQFHTLPDRLPYEADTFDIGISSHFLLLYASLGYGFHIAAIGEMLRVCKEVRIFPYLDMDSRDSSLTHDVLRHFRRKYHIRVVDTTYELQKGCNKLLVISKERVPQLQTASVSMC